MDDEWTPATPEESRRFFRTLIIMTTVNVAGIIFLAGTYLLGHNLLGLPFLVALVFWIIAQAVVIAL